MVAFGRGIPAELGVNFAAMAQLWAIVWEALAFVGAIF